MNDAEAYPTTLHTPGGVFELRDGVVYKQVDVDNDHYDWERAQPWELWHALVTLNDELIATREDSRKILVDNTVLKGLHAQLRRALENYFSHYGTEHEEGCPEDDTCQCVLTSPLNKISREISQRVFDIDHPGDNLALLILRAKYTGQELQRILDHLKDLTIGSAID
jgi:hypothetical protein